MNWRFWLDYRQVAVPKAGSLLACVDSTGARDVSLELVTTRIPGRFESWLYRALGLVLEPSDPIATLSALLTPSMAHVTFGTGEDDFHTVIAAGDATPDGSVVSFTLPTVETQVVPHHLCIPRASALQLFEAFLASGQRPRTITWVSQHPAEA